MYSQEERMTAVHAYINSNFNENCWRPTEITIWGYFR